MGGIFSADDAWEKITAGASLVQVYTGLVYEGPDLARELVRGLQQRLRVGGFATLASAVGSAALEQQQVQAYTLHSKGMLAQIHTGISAEYGDLSDGQKRNINAAYLYANQTNPEFHARHNAGDPALVTEFVKAYLDDMVEPLKRKITASEAGRFRPVPGGRDRSTPMKGEKAVDPTDNKAVMELLASSRRGKFGR